MLHAAVDSVLEEYGGLLQTLRTLKDDPSSGAMATGLLKKMDSVDFLGVLYILKHMLPHLSILSKTFQKGAVNIARITPSIERLNGNLNEICHEDTVLKRLKSDITGRLQQCEISLTDTAEERIRRAETYAQAIIANIDDRFPFTSICT